MTVLETMYGDFWRLVSADRRHLMDKLKILLGDETLLESSLMLSSTVSPDFPYLANPFHCSKLIHILKKSHIWFLTI